MSENKLVEELVKLSLFDSLSVIDFNVNFKYGKIVQAKASDELKQGNRL